MGYPTADDILGATATEEDELRWRLAISAIEQFTRQRFTSTGESETRYFSGQGTDLVYLDQRLAILEGTSMNGTGLEVDTLTLGPQRNRLGFASVRFGTWADKAVAQAEWGDLPRAFAIGTDNIAVTGIWGWTDDEWAASGGELQSVRDALALTMEDLKRVDENALAESVEAARSLGVSAISQGGLNVDLSNRETNLPRRVKILLSGQTPSGEPLRFPAGAGALV